MNPIADLFRRITLGVYVIGVADGSRRSAFTAAWVTQTSYRPLVLALSVNPRNASYSILKSGCGFVVNVLKADQLELARHFGTTSGDDLDKLAGIAWRPGHRGMPVLQDALAYCECELLSSTPAGDHELVLGQVVHGELIDRVARPMNYADTGNLDASGTLYPSSF